MSSAAARIQVGGTVVPDQHVYITRPEDDLLFDLLLDGQFCNVLTSRQMGKSSLMQWTAARLRSQGIGVATMDIAGEIGEEPDQEVAWRTIIDKIAEDLRIDFDVDAWWKAQPESTNNRALLRFFRDVVCANIAGPVVVFFDEIDSTLRLPYADDLFTAMRALYNERATEEAYRRLTFCVVGVATPNELVKDRRTTAYNIGTTIPLRDFDEERDDLTPLLSVLDVEDGEALPLLRRILYWTDGHPFLTAKFCKVIAGKSVEDVDAYVESKYADLSELRADDHFSQILRFFDDRLKGDAALEALAILEHIVRGRTELDRATIAHAQLKLSGIVKPNSRSELVIRNRLYARLFDREWLQSLKPKKKLRWLRRTAVAAVVALLILLIAIFVYARIYYPREVAGFYLKRIDDPSITLREAKECRAILAGERADPVTRITLKGYEVEAKAAYERMSTLWIAGRLARADDLIARGKVTEGLVLAAYIAQETEENLESRFEEEYTSRGYDSLVTTLRSSFEFWPGLAVSADGHNVAIGNVWWAEKGDTWYGARLDNTASINTVAFGPDGHLYSGDDDGAITEWEFDATGKLISKPVTVVDGRPRVLDLTVEADGRPAVIAEGDDARRLTISEQSVVLRTQESSGAIAVAEDGKTFVTTAGNMLTVWTANGGALRYRADGSISFRDVTIGPDGTIAVAKQRAVALLAHQFLIKETASIPHVPPVRSVALSKNLLATASDQGARVFDLKSLRDLALPLGEAHERRGSDVQAVAIDPQQNRLIVRRRDSVQIWSLGGKSESGGTRLEQWQRKFGLSIVNDGYVQ